MKLFRKRKKAENVEIRENVIAEEMPEGGDQPGNRMLDECEQMIEAAKALEDTKSEYKVVTSYLNDIQLLEDMSEEEMAEIRQAAENVVALGNTRTEYMKTGKKDQRCTVPADAAGRRRDTGCDQTPGIQRSISGSRNTGYAVSGIGKNEMGVQCGSAARRAEFPAKTFHYPVFCGGYRVCGTFGTAVDLCGEYPVDLDALFIRGGCLRVFDLSPGTE